MFFNHENVTRALKGNESIKEGDYHQALLDICYDKWQKSEDAPYKDMATYARIEFGEFVEFALLTGIYNQQVTNGGHIQYYDNGYADGSGGCFSTHDSSCPLHNRLINLMRRLKLNQTELEKKILSIYGDFINYLDEELELIEEHCPGEQRPFDELDDRYYACYNEWVDYLNNMSKQYINGAQNAAQQCEAPLMEQQ